MTNELYPVKGSDPPVAIEDIYPPDPDENPPRDAAQIYQALFSATAEACAHDLASDVGKPFKIDTATSRITVARGDRLTWGDLCFAFRGLAEYVNKEDLYRRMIAINVWTGHEPSVQAVIGLSPRLEAAVQRRAEPVKDRDGDSAGDLNGLNARNFYNVPGSNPHITLQDQIDRRAPRRDAALVYKAIVTAMTEECGKEIDADVIRSFRISNDASEVYFVRNGRAKGTPIKHGELCSGMRGIGEYLTQESFYFDEIEMGISTQRLPFRSAEVFIQSKQPIKTVTTF